MPQKPSLLVTAIEAEKSAQVAQVSSLVRDMLMLAKPRDPRMVVTLPARGTFFSRSAFRGPPAFSPPVTIVSTLLA